MGPARHLTPMSTPLIYDLVGGLPDPGDSRLAARCGGDVRGRALASAEQLLRILTSFPAGSVRIAIHLAFDPKRRREQRTKVRMVALRRDESDSAANGTAEALRLLLEAGPLQSVYGGLLQEAANSTGLKESDGTKAPWLDLSAYREAYAVLRREEFQEPKAEARRLNHRLNNLPFGYYSVQPFEANGDNDWLGLDRILDRFQHPALVEIVAGPHDVAALAADQFDYHFRLTQLNASESTFDRHLGEEMRRKTAAQVVQDSVADRFGKSHEELMESLRLPHLAYAIRCWSGSPEEARLLAAVVAEECFAEGSYQIQSLRQSPELWEEATAAATDLAAMVLRRLGAPEGETEDGLSNLSQLMSVGTIDELVGAFRLPVGPSASTPRTFGLHTDPPPFEKDTWPPGKPPKEETTLFVGVDLELSSGSLKSNESKFAPADPTNLNQSYLKSLASLDPLFREPGANRAEIRLERKLLKKHLFVCGVPGSGKTTAMFNFVAQLAYQDTPFLVIEPAKTEYRMFKRFRHHPDPKIRALAENLQVYTIGEERVSPLRFNPMIRGADVTVEEHIGALMACFKASMPIDGPLEGILLESLDAVFKDPSPERPPKLIDLLGVAKQVLAAKGYDKEIVSNLGAMLDVRLGMLTRGSLGAVLGCDENVPTREQLFESMVVLEMDSLTQENACLMTLLVLTALRQHLRAKHKSGADLHHVVFLEEAHNIVGRVGDGGGEGSADPRGFAANYVARMLAEVRALGEGMIIADQLPSAVAPEVIKNTGAKLALRLVANDDREELGGTMLLDETGIAELARLPVGSGYFYREGYHRPRRVQTLNSHAFLSVAVGGEKVEFEPPGREDLKKLIEAEPWFQAGRIARDLLSSCERFAELTERGRKVIDWFEVAVKELRAATLQYTESWDREALIQQISEFATRRSTNLKFAAQCAAFGQFLLAMAASPRVDPRIVPRVFKCYDICMDDVLRKLVFSETEARHVLATALAVLDKVRDIETRPVKLAVSRSLVTSEEFRRNLDEFLDGYVRRADDALKYATEGLKKERWPRAARLPADPKLAENQKRNEEIVTQYFEELRETTKGEICKAHAVAKSLALLAMAKSWVDPNQCALWACLDSTELEKRLPVAPELESIVSTGAKHFEELIGNLRLAARKADYILATSSSEAED